MGNAILSIHILLLRVEERWEIFGTETKILYTYLESVYTNFYFEVKSSTDII
jgi:hypothetical protein